MPKCNPSIHLTTRPYLGSDSLADTEEARHHILLNPVRQPTACSNVRVVLPRLSATSVPIAVFVLTSGIGVSAAAAQLPFSKLRIFGLYPTIFNRQPLGP